MLVLVVVVVVVVVLVVVIAAVVVVVTPPLLVAATQLTPFKLASEHQELITGSTGIRANALAISPTDRAAIVRPTKAALVWVC